MQKIRDSKAGEWEDLHKKLVSEATQCSIQQMFLSFLIEEFVRRVNEFVVPNTVPKSHSNQHNWHIYA